MLKCHAATHRYQLAAAKPIRPTRVAARRQHELMVVIAQFDNAESMEWHDEDDLDLTAMTVPQADYVTGLPVCSMAHYFSSPWHDD